jgi:hypothetical protein
MFHASFKGKLLLVLLLTQMLPWINSVEAQTLKRRSWMENLKESIASVLSAKNSIENFSREIQASRETYRQLYPDKPGVKNAYEKYQVMLFRKDLFFLASGLANSELGSNTTARQLFNWTTGGGKLDGGIPNDQKRSFDLWAMTVRFKLVSLQEGLTVQSLEKALKLAAPEYESYVWLREIDEHRMFTDPNNSWIESKNNEEYAYGLFLALKGSNPENLKKRIKDLKQYMGQAAFDTAIQECRSIITRNYLATHRTTFRILFKKHFFDPVINLKSPYCHDLSAYQPRILVTRSMVDKESLNFKYTDSCGTHGIDYVLTGYNIMGGEALFFTDISNQRYTAGVDTRVNGPTKQFMDSATNRFYVFKVPPGEYSGIYGRSFQNEESYEKLVTFQKNYPAYALILSSYSMNPFYLFYSTRYNLAKEIWGRAEIW